MIGEGNGNPLQCSCLENLRDGGAWWAAIYGVTQSRSWLSDLAAAAWYMIKVNQLSVTCNPPSSSLLSPSTAGWRPGHPADSSQPAAVHDLLHWGGGLHLLQLLQPRANSRAENSSCSTRRTVLSTNPDAGLKDSLLPVESAAVPQRCYSKVVWESQREK